MFSMNALISSPLKNTFHNPDAVAPAVIRNGGKAPRSTMDEDVLTSSLSKDKVKKSNNVTDYVRYLGSGSGPSVEKVLFPDDSGVLNRILEAISAMNTKLDVLTERSTVFEEQFKVLKKQMEHSKGQAEQLCSVVSEVTIDVQRLGAAVVAIQEEIVRMKKDKELPRAQSRNMHHIPDRQQQQQQQQQQPQHSGGEGGRGWEDPNAKKIRGGAQTSTRPQVRVMGRQAPAYWKKCTVMGFRVPIGREVKGVMDTKKACMERAKKIVEEVAALCDMEVEEVSCDAWTPRDLKPGENAETMTIRLGLPDKDAAYTVYMKRDLIAERSVILKGIFVKEDLNKAEQELKKVRMPYYEKCKEAAKGRAHVRFQGAKIMTNDTYVLSRDEEGKQYKSDMGVWNEVSDYEIVPKWREDEWDGQEGPVESMAVDRKEGEEEEGPEKEMDNEPSVSK
jgi:phage-related tail protein